MCIVECVECVECGAYACQNIKQFFTFVMDYLDLIMNHDIHGHVDTNDDNDNDNMIIRRELFIIKRK